MQPTGLATVALVATAATLFASADAHGKMTVPAYRQMSEKFHKDSGALINIGLNEMQIAPIEGLSQHKQKDFPPSPTFNLQNGCRGTVYEKGSEVTTLEPGKEFDVKWKIEAPHPGYMKLSILKPSEDSKGTITYKSYKQLLNIEPFAENGGEGGTTAKMPADVQGCDKPGDCVLQFYWHSDIAKQTYPTCADIVVSGSGAGASTPSTSTTENGGSETEGSDESTPSTSTNESPSTTNNTPSTNNNTPSTNETPSTNNTPSTNETPSTNNSSSTSFTPSSNESPSTANNPPSASFTPSTNNSPSTNKAPSTNFTPSSNESPSTNFAPSTSTSTTAPSYSFNGW